MRLVQVSFPLRNVRSSPRRTPAKARHPSGGPRRVPLERRRGRGAVRRQGQAAPQPGAQLFRQRFPGQRQESAADAAGGRCRDDRGAERAAVAAPREQPDQGVPAPVQRPAQGRQELSVDRRDASRIRFPGCWSPGGATFRGPLLRALYRRRRDAAHPGPGAPHLHGAKLRRRSPRRAAGAALPRLPHRALPGALRRLAGRGGLPGHDCRRGRLSRGQDRGRPDPAPGHDAGRQHPGRLRARQGSP